MNENALKIARLNAAFNETLWMRFVKLDVQEDLTSHLKKQFDLIIGNLPIIPTPQETNCKWFRRLHSDGGADGQTFLKSALTQAPSLLERNGEAIFLACSLGTPNRPFLLEHLTEMASRLGMSIKVAVIKKYQSNWMLSLGHMARSDNITLGCIFLRNKEQQHGIASSFA